MAKLFNLARMTTATAGTGTITLGAAVPGYLTFAQAGAANGDVLDYAIKDGNNSEIGTGTYTASGTTLTRAITSSTNGNAALNLSGTAEVFITPRAETLADASFLTTGALSAARIISKSLDQSKLNLSGVSNTGVADLNSLTTAGFYANTGYKNTPEGAGATLNYWYVIVQEWSTGVYTQQMAMPLSPSTNQVYVRTQQGGVWSSWERLQKEIENTRVLLTTLTANNTSSVIAPSSTIFQSGYLDYEIVFRNLTPAATGAQFGMRYYIGGTNITSGYIASSLANAGSTIPANSTAWIPLSNPSTNWVANSNGGVSGRAVVFNPRGGQSKSAIAQYQHVAHNNVNGSLNGTASGVLVTGSALDGFNIQCDTGNIASGTVSVYGLR